jgi:hypothetical protein
MVYGAAQSAGESAIAKRNSARGIAAERLIWKEGRANHHVVVRQLGWRPKGTSLASPSVGEMAGSRNHEARPTVTSASVPFTRKLALHWIHRQPSLPTNRPSYTPNFRRVKNSVRCAAGFAELTASKSFPAMPSGSPDAAQMSGEGRANI